MEVDLIIEQDKASNDACYSWYHLPFSVIVSKLSLLLVFESSTILGALNANLSPLLGVGVVLRAVLVAVTGVGDVNVNGDGVDKEKDAVGSGGGHDMDVI